MATTYEAIATVTVGSGGAANIEFTSIPATYTDLNILLSSRVSRSASDSNLLISFNSSTANFSGRYLEGLGSGTPGSSTFARFIGAAPATNATANTFGNTSVYIPNYTGSNNKSFSVDASAEDNATVATLYFIAGLWSDTSAITSVKIQPQTADNFAQYSTATLYGIKNS
jgi:hypothetical protein